MDASRFDAWTRRRFGAAAAGVCAGLLGFTTRDDAGARKKKRGNKRKRPCEKLGTKCNPNNNEQLCCGALFCQSVPELGGNRCCQTLLAPCSRDADCCRNLFCGGAAAPFCRAEV